MLLRFEAILVLAIVFGPLIVDAWPAIAALFTFQYWDADGSSKATKSEVARNLGLFIVATLALIIGGIRAVTANRQANIANEQARIAERGHFTDRYSSAVDNMASGHMAIRLGGIYALFQLAEEAKGGDYISVMDMLCAFVRSPTGNVGSDGETLREDVQEILIKLFLRGDARLCRAGYGINLRGANLNGAYLRGANLSEANLSGASLYEANLYGAILYGAILYGAILREANLSEANLSGANLREANLSGANLIGADLVRANLFDANLSGAFISFAGFRSADLSGANFENAKGDPDLSDSCADQDHPPFSLPDSVKRPDYWLPCPPREEWN